MEAHPTLEYQKIKGDKTYVEAPWLWRPLGNNPDCPVLNPALLVCAPRGSGEWGGGGGVATPSIPGRFFMFIPNILNEIYELIIVTLLIDS